MCCDNERLGLSLGNQWLGLAPGPAFLGLIADQTRVSLGLGELVLCQAREAHGSIMARMHWRLFGKIFRMVK